MSTQTQNLNLRDGGNSTIPPELKLGDLVALKQSENGEYYLEPNTKLLKKLESRGVDHAFCEKDQEFSVFDGEAGLYVTLLNHLDDVVLLEYHDSFMSMYKLARFGDVRGMKVVECEEGSCGVITPSREQFDIVSD